jgi:trehalose-6-phosphate synthase
MLGESAALSRIVFFIRQHEKIPSQDWKEGLPRWRNILSWIIADLAGFQSRSGIILDAASRADEEV